MPNLSLRKLWRKRSVTISEKDPSYKVNYLGNVLTGWAKGEGCVDQPLSTLWRNYCQSTRSDIVMKITICSSGLQAVTREHGLTEYWAHRVTYCGAHPSYPKVFCWVYRHEGRRLKQELRCHAVLCHRSDKALVMAEQLKERLVRALHEFRREKVTRQNNRLSLMHVIYDTAALPTRKVLLSTGTANYRPPLERSKSAPKLGSIEETIEEDEDSPTEDEDEACDAREKNVQCSPVGSIAISETMSDIVHYNNAADLTAAFVLSRSSLKNTDSKKNEDEEGESPSSNRASNSSSNNGSNSNGSSISSNNSSGSSSSNRLSNKSSLYVYTGKIATSLKAPVLQRRFIRSVSVDTSLDNEEVSDFDDDDDSEIMSKDVRLENRSSRGSLGNPFNVVSKELSATEEESCSSLTSTDTTETVLDRPHTTEDTISLMNSLSRSLSRQMSLPPEANPPEESLTSDQPESLGSHGDSCASSCGGCSDAGTDSHPQEDVGGAVSKDRLLLVVGGTLENLGNLSSLGADVEEPDNISEESGYAEEKDFLQNVELTKALNA